ncbi:unnamed protein product [Paramecium sonneborni]|uniref:Uncharacterized protein n=1 Tax=Paramecium sonneborni TaxID=65129 RepID=A0A8S1PHZ5_9CILI|nr:unnamed protein product [Paramecium sonneborni]
MAKELCFDNQQTINSDEDDKQIDVFTFPTTFFLFSEISTHSLSNSESANLPISSPRYKFMGENYSSEYQELNIQAKTFKDKKIALVDHNLNNQTKKCSFLLRSRNEFIQMSQQTLIQKQTNCESLTQRNSPEKQEKKVKNGQNLWLPPRPKKFNEKRIISNKLNGILKESCIKSPAYGNSKTRPNFDLFIGRPSNKNVSFKFTIEQIKTMKNINKSNIFSAINENEKKTRLFLV